LEDAKVVNNLVIAETEQYRTNNLVNAPRSISVSMSYSGQAPNPNVATSIQNAIGRYNAENLTLSFSWAGIGGNGDINVKIVNGGGYIASAGFPSGGNPYGEIKFNKNYQNWQLNTLTSVMAHEIGHCIGFRHTDYADRSFSCGGAYANEGAGSVGAVHIPGTPTTNEVDGSWMLACIGNGINRPFINSDKTALSTLY
jgi:Dual-action HEIGH metallo-peptidase